MFYLSIPHLGQKTCFYGNGCTMVHEQRAAVRCDAVRCRELRETTRKKGKRLVVRGFLFGGGGASPLFLVLFALLGVTLDMATRVLHTLNLSFCFFPFVLYTRPCSLFLVLFCFVFLSLPFLGRNSPLHVVMCPPPFFVLGEGEYVVWGTPAIVRGGAKGHHYHYYHYLLSSLPFFSFFLWLLLHSLHDYIYFFC